MKTYIFTLLLVLIANFELIYSFPEQGKWTLSLTEVTLSLSLTLTLTVSNTNT